MNKWIDCWIRTGGMLVLAMSLMTGAADAGCNCGKGGGVSYGPPVAPSYVRAESYVDDGISSGGFGDMQSLGGGAGYSLPVTADVAPPPGTLGQTYQRAMRPIPVDKHPRISIVDVRAPGATAIKIYGTNEYRTKDGFSGFQDRRDPSVWRLESDPLIPGVPHIYRVVAKYGDTAQERYIRLVPGRIVTLDF